MTAPYREPADVSDLPEPHHEYPVVIEETRRYVLWIAAETPADAVAEFNYEPHDPGNEAMFSFDWSSEVPDDFDWDRIECPWSGGGWTGTLADAHVRTWQDHVYRVKRDAARAACSAAGHPIPERTGRLVWPDYCETCGQIDPSARTAPGHAAEGGEPKATPNASDLAVLREDGEQR